MNIKTCCLIILILLLFPQCVTPGEETWRVVSPGGQVGVRVFLDPEPGTLRYCVFLEGKKAIDTSSLGIALRGEGHDYTGGLRFTGSRDSAISETYTLPVGKVSTYRNRANELTLAFENASGHPLELVIRSYDDGMAYRYRLHNERRDTVREEINEFALDPASLGWVHKYTPESEHYYFKRKLDTMARPGYILPALFETPAGQWVFLSDAAVFGDYAACRLEHKGNGVLAMVLPRQRFNREPQPGTWQEVVAGETGRVVVGAGLTTPWRAAILGEQLKTLVHSTLPENLNPPTVTGETDWIEPGVAVFPWWGESEANDDPETLKDYIDMAAEMEWEYLEFDIGLLRNKGGYAADFWREVDYIPDIVNYASSKGIRVYGWDERRNLDTPEKRAGIFGTYRDWGIAGIKMDFINSDLQEAMQWYRDATRDAARYRLLVSYHGAITPRGARRTLPNIMTYEAVRGAEYFKWSRPEGIPVHNCTLPFTRNISGPMDYTPCTFSFGARETTYAHELALPFVFESGWTCMADKPEAYRNSPAREILQKLHAAWDGIRFIDGYPGEFCCLARRKGADWYVAAINGPRERTVDIPLDFIGEGEHRVKIYTDGEGENAFLQVMQRDIRKGEKLTLKLKKNGGFVFMVPG